MKYKVNLDTVENNYLKKYLKNKKIKSEKVLDCNYPEVIYYGSKEDLTEMIIELWDDEYLLKFIEKV